MDRQQIKSGELIKDIQYGEKTMIHAAVHYPILLTPSATGPDRVNRCYKNAAENIVEAAGGGLLREAIEAYEFAPDFFQPYEVSAGYTVTYNDSGWVSLYTDVYIYAGGAHGVTYRYGSTWRLGSGHPVFITGLFPDSTQIRKTVCGFVADQCKRTRNLDEGGYEGLLADARAHYTPENFYLTDAGLAVFYQQYALGPYTAGIPVFVMPYDDTEGPFSPKREK